MSMADLIQYLGGALPNTQLPAGASDPLSQAYLQSSTQRAIAALNAAQQLAQQQQTAQLRQTELMGADPTGNLTNAAQQWRSELEAQQGVQEATLQQRLLQLMGVDTSGNQTLESRTAGQTANARMAELLGYDPTTGARTLAGTTTMGYDQYGRPTLAAQNQTAEQQAKSAALMGWDQYGRPTLAGQAQQSQQAQQQAEAARQLAQTLGYDQYGNVTLAGQAQQATQAQQQAEQARQLAQTLGYDQYGNVTLAGQAQQATQAQQQAEAARQLAQTFGYDQYGNATLAAQGQQAQQAQQQADQMRQMAQLLGYTSTGNPTLDAQRLAEQSRQFSEQQRAAESQFARTYGLQTQASERATGELTGSFNGGLTEAARAARAKEALDRANTAAALGQNPRDVFKSAAWFKQINGADPSGIGLSGGNISGFTTPGRPAPGTVDLPTMMAALYGNQQISTPQAGGSLTALPANSFNVAGPGQINIPGNPSADYSDIKNLPIWQQSANPSATYSQVNNLPIWQQSANPSSAYGQVNNLPVWQKGSDPSSAYQQINAFPGWQQSAGGSPYATAVWNPSADPSLTAPYVPTLGSAPLSPPPPGGYTPPGSYGSSPTAPPGASPGAPSPGSPGSTGSPNMPTWGPPASGSETGGTPATDPTGSFGGSPAPHGGGFPDATRRADRAGETPGGPVGPVTPMPSPPMGGGAPMPTPMLPPPPAGPPPPSGPLGMGAGGDFVGRAPSPLQDPAMMMMLEKVALLAKKQGKGSRSGHKTPARMTLRPDDKKSPHDMQSKNDHQKLITGAAVQDHRNKKRIADALMRLGGIPGMGPGGPVGAPLYPTDGGTSTPTLQAPNSVGASMPQMSMAAPAPSSLPNPLAAFASNPPGFADTGAIDAHQAAIAQALGQGVQSFAPQTFARMNDTQKQILQGAAQSIGLSPKDLEEAINQVQFANTGSSARA